MKFRTRVEHVEAVQCNIVAGSRELQTPPSVRWGDTIIPEWLRNFTRTESVRLESTSSDIRVYAVIGGMKLYDGDWLVRDEDGTIGVCRKDAFASSYEADAPDEDASYFVFDPKYAKQMRSEADARAYATDMLSCGEIKERAAVLRIVAMFELERPKVVEVKPASPNRTKD